MTSTPLELRQVGIDFGDGHLFRDVNLKINDHESFVLIGPSGLGKSVVLKLFAGLLQPSSGQVLLHGQDLAVISLHNRNHLLLSMGMLFQKNALFDSMSVFENVAFPLRETGLALENEIRERVEFYLEEVGLADARDRFPDEISGGMQKRLGIARALILNPKIVLYDDPTAGLDPITSRKIVDLILRLHEEQRSTIVSITNDMARAFQLADRIAMVADGEIVVTGNAQETLQHKDPRVAQFIRGKLEGPLTEART